jgi:outer membrane lipoprotein SlyB
MAKMTKAEKKRAAAARRRNRMKGVNVLSLAEGYVQTNIWTEKLFNTNPFEFVTGITSGTYNPGSDGGSVISIPEILGARGGGNTGALGGSFGSYAADLPGAVARNITGKTSSDPMEVATSLIMPAIQTTLVGVGFKFGKKMTAKPRSAINRGLRQFGLGDFIRF